MQVLVECCLHTLRHRQTAAAPHRLVSRPHKTPHLQLLLVLHPASVPRPAQASATATGSFLMQDWLAELEHAQACSRLQSANKPGWAM